jgi:hypothetical protein
MRLALPFQHLDTFLDDPMAVPAAGIVNLTAIGAASVQESRERHTWRAMEGERDGGPVPEVKRLLEQAPMAGCGEEMSAQAKDSVDRLEHTEKTLSVL